MIQLELFDDDPATEHLALVCDRCGRAWFRSAGTDPTGLRDAAVYRGWGCDNQGDTCPHCIRKARKKR